jgi:hypothetical protein
MWVLHCSKGSQEQVGNAGKEKDQTNKQYEQK